MIAIAGVYYCWRVMRRIKKLFIFNPKIETRLIQNNGKQSTDLHIDVVACLFIPPNILQKLD